MYFKKLDEQQNNRLKKLVINTLIIVTIGLAYYLFVKLTGLRIPCVLYELTGIHCPGCGVTRMCMSLIEFDINSAIKNNLLVFCLLPLFAAYYIRYSILYVKNGNIKYNKIETIIIIIIFILMIVFVVLRNLPSFSWLAPIPFDR